MTDDRSTDGQWLTYAEAAERLSTTTEAVRALARRKRWERRSPNAIGGQAWVLIPADRLVGAAANGRHDPPDGQSDVGQRSIKGIDRERPAPTNGQSDPANGHDGTEQRPPPVADSPDGQADDRRAAEILTAVREVAEMLAAPLREQIAAAHQQIGSLTEQLMAATERADRAEKRAGEAQEALEAQTADHRRVVELLVQRIPQRRSWWPWRRHPRS